jgi:hypothetical protein
VHDRGLAASLSPTPDLVVIGSRRSLPHRP